MELQGLLDTLPPGKILAATRDLHFNWSQVNKLRTGQVDVLLKRLKHAAAKTVDDYNEAAEASDHIQAMRQSLINFQANMIILRRLLDEGSITQEDYNDEPGE